MAKPLVFTDLIIFENEDYCVVNKPAGVSSLPERDLTRFNILEWAKSEYGDVQLCHRLDKETSGALVIAKHPEAYRHLAIQFEGREVEKVYHAIVMGIHNFQERLVDLPISQSSKGTVRIDREMGKFSETTFTTVQTFRKHTLVACYPLTGRMHQIRIHLACLKAPIVGDETYGGKPVFLSEIKPRLNLKKFTEEQPIMDRVALHAFQITFKGLNNEPITASADYPKDIAALLKQLEKNA